MILDVENAYANGYLESSRGLTRGERCEFVREVGKDKVEIRLTDDGPRQNEVIVVDRSCLLGGRE